MAKDDTIYNNSEAVQGMTGAEEAALREEREAAKRVFKYRLQAVLSDFQNFTGGLHLVLLTTGAAAIIQQVHQFSSQKLSVY